MLHNELNTNLSSRKSIVLKKEEEYNYMRKNNILKKHDDV